MELNEFVKQTLIQIASGVKEAQSEVRKMGGIVNPAKSTGESPDAAYFGSVESGQSVFLIDFDVAVTVTEEAGTNAEAKLKVAPFISLGAGGASSSTNETTSRITFKVPLAIPVDEDSHQKHKQRLAEEDAKVKAHNTGQS